MKQGSRYRFYMHEAERADMPGPDTCGDFMPFFHQGVYHLFYLYKYCVYEVVTTDFVHYGEPRLAIPCGGPEDQDWHIGTGSVIEREGVFHFYYTGFNESHRDSPGKHEQVLMRAVSTDLIHWEKDASFYVTPDTEHYGGLHWRDPQVFWNDREGEYWLAVTATAKDGDHNRGGCTHILKSSDLQSWRPGAMVYAPGTFATHECHDIFQMGEWWYMIFSNYSRWWETRYRMAKSPAGPWITPAADDMFDGRAFYAAKTVSNGKSRYLVGWHAIRSGMDDKKPYQWGGSALVHELVQRPDGTLGVKPVQALAESYHSALPQAAAAHRGNWTFQNGVRGSEPYGFGWAEVGSMSEACLIKAKLRWTPGTVACGLMLHVAGPRLEKWCQVRLEPARNRVVFDRSNKFDGDQLFIEERDVPLADANEAEVKVFVNGTAIVIYVNDTALATRAYDYEPGGCGLFVEHGEAEFMELDILE